MDKKITAWYLVMPWYKRLFLHYRNIDDTLCMGHWGLWRKLGIARLVHRYSNKCKVEEVFFYYSDGTN